MFHLNIYKCRVISSTGRIFCISFAYSMRVKLFYNLVVISFVKCNPTPCLMYVLRWPPDGSFIVGSMWWWQFISLTHLTGSWFIICFHNTASLYSSKPVNLKNCPKSSQHDGVILITSRGIITKERWNPNQKLHHKYSPLEVQITSIVIYPELFWHVYLVYIFILTHFTDFTPIHTGCGSPIF